MVKANVTLLYPKGENPPVSTQCCIKSVEVASLHHPISPGAGVRVGVPGLLFNPQCRFGQDRAEPAGNVHANMIDLVGVLADPARSICIRLVF